MSEFAATDWPAAAAAPTANSWPPVNPRSHDSRRPGSNLCPRPRVALPVIAFQQPLDLGFDRRQFALARSKRVRTNSRSSRSLRIGESRPPAAGCRPERMSPQHSQQQLGVFVRRSCGGRAVVDRAGDFGGSQHVALDPGVGQLVVQTEALPGELHRQRSRVGPLGRSGPQQGEQFLPTWLRVANRHTVFRPGPSPTAIFNNIVWACKSQPTMIISHMARPPGG